jgi:hypothetical protein
LEIVMTNAQSTHKSHNWLADLGHAIDRVLHAGPATQQPRWGSYIVRYL